MPPEAHAAKKTRLAAICTPEARSCSKAQAAADGGSVLSAPCGARSDALVWQSCAARAARNLNYGS
eukprot:186908-Pyramimonas_sp.AAC.1